MMRETGRVVENARFTAILFDFDGVLVDSEYAGNLNIAKWLNEAGYAASPEQVASKLMGKSGSAFTQTLEQWIGAPVPAAFDELRHLERERQMINGIDAVRGAVSFVNDLPKDLPIAVASSSLKVWIDRHLRHIGLRETFGGHIFSGQEDVVVGKPAPDIYFHAASQLGVRISDCVVLEDSLSGASAAVSSGAYVIGLCAGSHSSPDLAKGLLSIGVNEIAMSFDSVRKKLGL